MPRIFIGYKYQNVNKKLLKKRIEKITSTLEKKDFQTFNYFRDKENWKPQNFPPGKVIKEAFKELKKCDALLIFVDSPRKSEGIFLELGFAKALGKKTILLISKKVTLPTLESISDQVIKFDNFKNIEKSLDKIKL